MKVLIVYGSTRGSTKAVARWISEWLGGRGIIADVFSAEEAPDVEPYDGVIVGGAVYARRWHPDARHWVLEHAEALRAVPTWMFSSGPLDASALRTNPPPVPEVAELMSEVGARGHRTFGGVLSRHPRGLLARLMARRHAGDWRNPLLVQHWCDEIADELKERNHRPAEQGEHAPHP